MTITLIAVATAWCVFDANAVPAHRWGPCFETLPKCEAVASTHQTLSDGHGYMLCRELSH